MQEKKMTCGISFLPFFTPFSCNHNQQPLSISVKSFTASFLKKINTGEERSDESIGSKQYRRKQKS
jgi:hypothetical protein